MMNQNQVLLATEEQALSNAISQLGACIHQDVQSLAGLDVGVQSTVVQGLTAKVQEQLRQYRSLLGDLQHAAEEQETPEQTQRVAYVLGKHQSDYDSIHKAFQDARIHFQRRKEQSYVQQRQELIGSVDFSQRQQKFASEQEAVLGAQDVTASLRRTRQLMAQNLEQTHGNISVIASSNKRLQSAGDELTGQKDIFKESHGLLGTLKTQSLLDKFAMWGGFTFFMLVVLYISFKRTPAFMKQPLYSLLHMKPTGKPFDHQDYAAANIPPGTFKPSDQPWAAAGGDGGGEQAYPADWAAWDANFADMPGHGEAVYKDSDWQELLNEGLQQETGESWQRGPDGSLRPLQQQQQRMAAGEPGAPGMSDQQQQASDTWGCSAADGDGSCHGVVDGDAAGFQAGQQATAAPIHVTKAQFDTQQQQQQHDDEDELAFHSGAAYHPSDENASDQHIDVHWTAQQQQQQPEWHGSQPPPAALGIIDPEAAAVAAGSDTAAADYQQDPDELEYQVKQQQQQVEEVVPPAQQQQHLQLQQQQQKEEQQQQQQQQEQQTAEAYAEEPVATEFVAQAPDLAAPDASAASPDESKLPPTPPAADDGTAASAPTGFADTSSSQEAVINTAQDSAAGNAPADIVVQSQPAPAAAVTGEQQQADISNDQQQAPSDMQPEQRHSSSPAVQDASQGYVTSEDVTVATGDAVEPPSGQRAAVGDLDQVLQQFEAPTTEDDSPQTPAAEGDSVHNAPVDQQPAAEHQQQQEMQEQQQEQMLVSAGLQTSDEVVGEPQQQQQQQQQQDQEIPPVTSGGHSSSTDSDVATTEQQQQQPGPVESQADIAPDATDSAADTLTQQQQQDLQDQQPPPSLAVDAAASGVSDDTLLQQGGGEVTTSAQPDSTAPFSSIKMLLDDDAVPTEQESDTEPAGVQQRQQQEQHLEVQHEQQQTPEQPAAAEPPVVEEATPVPVTEVTDNKPTTAADAADDDAQQQQQKQQQDSNADQVPHDMPHTPTELPEVDDRTVESASSDTWESSLETWESVSSSDEPDATVVIEELTHAPAGEFKVLDEQQHDQQQMQQQQESTISVDQPERSHTQTDTQQEQQKQHEQESSDLAAETAESAPDDAPTAVPAVSTPASEEAASVAAQQVAAGLSAAAADIVASVQPEIDTVGLNAKVQQAIQAKGQKFLSKLRNRFGGKTPAAATAAQGVGGVNRGNGGSFVTAAAAVEVQYQQAAGAEMQDSVHGAVH